MMTIQAKLPDDLVREARTLVEEGWAGDFDGVLTEALRRYLDTWAAHRIGTHSRRY